MSFVGLYFSSACCCCSSFRDTPVPSPTPSTEQAPHAREQGPQASQSAGSKPANPTQATHITPEQAKKLFRSVDAILAFDSHDTGLPILHPVKRRLVTRDEVQHYLMQQLHNGKDAKRLRRSELVLKKFGLLDRDFQLQPFLVQLLREQIAGYYNAKTKTVNLLDWIPPDEQKPVLAHELTHALQDQYIHLDKWGGDDDDLRIAKNVGQDNRHIATDEKSTVRDAVVEGQAMAVFVDYILAPSGKSLLNAPQYADRMNDAMRDNASSPVLANAPLVLQRSLIFPYVEGLDFVRAVLTARGKQAAFAGMLDHPPSSTYEIMTPKVYLDHEPVPLLRMPDIHPLIDPLYRPYDVGVMGEFDVQVMAELFGGSEMAKALAPAWRGGIYYAAQSKAAKTSSAQDSTASLATLYLSRWATPQAAQAFAGIYAQEIPRKYDHAIAIPNEDSDPEHATTSIRIWNTSEGPVLIAVSDKTVCISESFPMDLARKLEFVMVSSITDSSTNTIAGSEMPRSDLTADLRHTLFTVAAPQGYDVHTVY